MARAAAYSNTLGAAPEREVRDQTGLPIWAAGRWTLLPQEICHDDSGPYTLIPYGNRLFRTAIGFDRLARVMPEALKLRNIAISGAVSVPGGRTESRLTQAVAGLGQ